MSLNSKALSGVTRYIARWRDRISKRTNRIYDDRDNALADAIKNLEERPNSIYPYVTEIEGLEGGVLPLAAVTGLVIRGNNFVGDASKAAGSTSSSSGQLDFTARLPGEQTITVTITDDGSALAVDAADASAGTIDIVLGDGAGAGGGGAYTAAEVKAVIDAHAEAKYMVDVAIGTAGDMDADESVTVEVTAYDPGVLPVLQLGSVSIDGTAAGTGISAWDEAAITFDIDASGLAAGEVHMLRLWVDEVLVLELPVSVAGAAGQLAAVGTISALEARTLNATPIELVAAPGAGKMIVVDSIHWFYDFAGAAYDGTKTGNLMAKYTDGSGDEVVGQVAETGFMDQTADVHALTHGVDCVPVANAAVVAHSSNDWYSSAGDSPVKYEVLYHVVDADPTA